MICLSFDTDHLDDARIAEFLDEVEIPGSGTFFCTQAYASLAGADHELCPHPTLDPGADWDAALDSAREWFPDARGIRPHSCLNSHMLSVELNRRGFEWVSSRDEPGRVGIAPYREAWGVWHLPIYYMDNMDFSAPLYWDEAGTVFDRELIEAATGAEGLYVFDFHPIHLLLNSTSAEAYFERRDRFLAGEPLDGLRCPGYGARSFYEDLLEEMARAGRSSARMSDAI